MTCVQAEYGEISRQLVIVIFSLLFINPSRLLCNETGEGLVSVRNTAYLANGAVTDISGTATEPFPDQPGYLEVKFPYRKSKL